MLQGQSAWTGLGLLPAERLHMRGFRSGRVPWMTTMQRYSSLRMLALCKFAESFSLTYSATSSLNGFQIPCSDFRDPFVVNSRGNVHASLGHWQGDPLSFALACHLSRLAGH